MKGKEGDIMKILFIIIFIILLYFNGFLLTLSSYQWKYEFWVVPTYVIDCMLLGYSLLKILKQQ